MEVWTLREGGRHGFEKGMMPTEEVLEEGKIETKKFHYCSELEIKN